MMTQLEKCFWQPVVALAVALWITSFASAQTIRNGEFDEGTNWWFSVGDTQLETTDDSYQTGSAMLVTERNVFWHGLGQDFTGQLEAGKDYHVQAWIKPAAGESGTMRVNLYQTDDRGERALRLGEVFCEADQWTRIQGAFTYDPLGDVPSVWLGFDNSYTDHQTYDFQIDSITITENDWRDAANARIEEIRKRDAVLSFVRSNGQPAIGLDVSAVQISHAFAFGSTMSHEVKYNPVYQEFFKDSFEWATMEWFAQWKPIELTQGVEDYSIADASLEFCEQNGIRIKGHALFWGQQEFRPTWLDGLGENELFQAMETRISSAVTRYGSRLFGWDVNNEMLDQDFFKENLGASIRSWMFTRAREFNPDIKLFLNEYGLETSEAKTVRYRDLCDELVADGADVGGVGFQSHFDGSVSPKGIEIAMDQFAGTDLGIWFTEYDAVHPDPVGRAQALEDFYRYTFSRPETQGIIMWGFWAGTHWLGPDASIVDLDWTLNAAGERYFSLMDEWTTEADGNTGSSGQFEFRGFLGSYLVTTTDDEGKVNHHLIDISNKEDIGTYELSFSPIKDMLLIYGTSEDDLFQFDLSNAGIVKINGKTVRLDLIADSSNVSFVGLAGNDRLSITSSAAGQNLLVNEGRLIVQSGGPTIRFEMIEAIDVVSESVDSRVVILDSVADDLVESFEGLTVMTTPNVALSTVGFGSSLVYSNSGNDTAQIHDSRQIDQFVTDLNFVRVERDQWIRRFTGFANNVVESDIAYDTLEVRTPILDKTIQMSPDDFIIDLTDSEKQFSFIDFHRVTILGEVDNPDVVSIVGGDDSETLSTNSNGSLYFGPGFRYRFDSSFQAFESLQDSAGHDRIVFRDSDGDDQISVIGDETNISGASSNHLFRFVDEVAAFSRAGGHDTATVSNPTASVRLVGDWNANAGQ